MPPHQPRGGHQPADLRPGWRDLTTRDLLDEREHWRWQWAEYASDPDQYPFDTIPFVRFHVDGIEAELARRERLRHRPEAPPWPAAGVDRRAGLDAIKARLSVKTFFETQTPVVLRKAGKFWRGCCPIHGGDNPTSFVVSDAWYYCHSCGAGGDLFNAARQIFDLDHFGDAVDVLADLVGIERSAPSAELGTKNSLGGVPMLVTSVPTVEVEGQMLSLRQKDSARVEGRWRSQRGGHRRAQLAP